MTRIGIQSLLLSLVTLTPAVASAVSSAEVYTSMPYGYGRFEARIRFAAGDGVVSSFFLWKDGSEVSGAFWNELDFEKLNADCHVETNAIYGSPPSNNNAVANFAGDPCDGYHVYAYEWTPDAIRFVVDGAEVRRDTGAAAAAFANNASSAGMQLRFNIWPGDASFGGNFNPSIMPVHQYIDWVQYSSYQNGQFTVAWREDFNSGSLPSGWLSGNWGSPKNLSNHAPGNANILNGYLVLSLTDDNAIGPAGAMPNDTGASGAGGMSGSGGGGGAGSDSGGAGAGGFGGTSAGGSSGMNAGGMSAGGMNTGGMSAGGSSGVAGSGVAGTDAAGGTDNAGGTNAAGGVSGSAGTSGVSGAASGNAGAGGGASGSANAGASGAAAGVAGTTGGAGSAGVGAAPPDDDTGGGFGCTLGASRAGQRQATWTLLALAFAAGIRRRERARTARG